MCMGIGYCKACRKHGVEVHYLDRRSDNTLIRGAYARPGAKSDFFESSGVCANCEQQTRVTKDELLRASRLWGEQAVHDMIAINEYLNSLDPDDTYDAVDLVTSAPVAMQFDPDRRASLGGLVMAAARVRLSNGTPRDMKQAARSVFIPFYQRMRMEDKVREMFSEKWQLF